MEFKAAILRQTRKPLTVETVSTGALHPGDVLVKVRASSICHTDLEVVEGEIAYPLPMVLGHEVAGVVAEVGEGVSTLRAGDPVVLHWNPHCGQCFYCENDQPILCEPYSKNRAQGAHFDGGHRLSRDGERMHVLMYLGGFAEYVVVPAQSAVKVPEAMPLDRGCLLGCGVMTGFGAAMRVAPVLAGSVAVVIGCGAIGLSAVQGARIAGAKHILALDIDDRKLAMAAAVGATVTCNPGSEDAVAVAKSLAAGRGADFVFECAGTEKAFQSSVELCRPGGQVVWLGKVNVNKTVSFRWGTLMGDRHIVRSSYGGARPHTDFPAMCEAYLRGDLKLDAMVTGRIGLDEINEGFDRLRRGEAIRTVIEFPA